MSEKNTLVVFDFDGTIFKSPYRPKGWKGKWWSNIDSIVPPVVPQIPDDVWWNEEIVLEAVSSIKHTESRVILLTGRLNNVFKVRINELLKSKELEFDFVGLAELDTSISSKIKHLEQQLQENKNIDKIIFYDDREEHYSLFEGYCKESGVECIINKVKEAYTVLDNKAIPDKKLYVLIGPPGSGKSTYIKNNFSSKDVIVLSRDEIVERVAEENGKTYNEMFSFNKEIRELNSIVTEELERNIDHASKSEKTVIVDMTNMNQKSRKNFLNRFPSDKFFRVAVDFTPELSQLDNLLKINVERDESLKKIGKRKIITNEILTSMMERYEPPSEEEGFNRITKIDISDRLNKVSTLQTI
jgi:predicted kinase